MIIPAKYNLIIPQRATFRTRMRLKSSGTPLNAEGYEVVAQIWDQRGKKKYVDFNVTWINRQNGLFELSLQHQTTAVLTKNGVWDLLVIEPGGDRYYWLEGLVLIDKGISIPVAP